MATMIEQAKARAAANKQAKQETSPPADPMEDSVEDKQEQEDEVNIHANAPKMPPEILQVTTAPIIEKKKGPPGSYRSCRLERFFRKDGNIVLPDANGFFSPKDEEEAEMLAHYEKSFDMVEYQD